MRCEGTAHRIARPCRQSVSTALAKTRARAPKSFLPCRAATEGFSEDVTPELGLKGKGDRLWVGEGCF